MKGKRGKLGTSKGNTAVILLVVILLIILGTGFYYFTQVKSPSQPTTPTASKSTTSSETEEQTAGKPLPAQDAADTKDIEVIGRYPGSVRTGNESVPESNYTSVSYVTKQSTDTIKEYYIEKLEEKGWEIVSAGTDEVRFAKEPATLRLHLYYDNQDKTLKYSLEYTSDTDF